MIYTFINPVKGTTLQKITLAFGDGRVGSQAEVVEAVLSSPFYTGFDSKVVKARRKQLLAATMQVRK